MSEEPDDGLESLLSNITIVGMDGSERKMEQDELGDMAEALRAASERSEEERPRMEAVIERLNAKIPDLHIEGLGGNVPIQGRGTYQGEEFYFRARYDSASLAVGSTDGEEVSSWNPARFAKVRVTEPGDEFGAGWLTPEEVEVVFPVLVENLEPRTQEQNDEAVEAFKRGVDEIVEAMKKARDG